MTGDGQPVLIEIDGLTKRFGSFTAVDNVSFSVARGEVLGFLGPNGAGKSTTMRMLAGFMIPTAGTARICGHDVQTDGVAARRVLGFLPEGAPTYPEMTVTGFLHVLRQGARLRRQGTGGARRSRAGADAAEACGCSRWRRCRKASSAASAWRRRCCTIRRCWCWTNRPTGWIPNQKHEVRSLIERMAPEKAIVISTHILEEVDAVCTRAIIIAAGRVVADATPAELQRRHPSGKLDDVFRQLTMEAA